MSANSMARSRDPNLATNANTSTVETEHQQVRNPPRGTRDHSHVEDGRASSNNSMNETEKERPPEKWSMGILNDKRTEEVPGTVLLLSSHRNEPLGLEHQPERTSQSSLPSPYPPSTRRPSAYSAMNKKRTPDGQILLDPQPDDSLNDPLNWPALRRDAALLSLGLYCMLGGGMTPILAAGFNNVAETYHVSYARVALTTGLYMMGLGVGSVIASPTAILFGKRPVYLFSALLFLLSAVWCALSPNFASLTVARIFQGISVSPVECLPSATIAEIFFLHERAFRIGIYTLLLLGGKNLMPLVSAAIIQALGWRWVFWIVALIVGFGLGLLFFFVPETFWDRAPRPKSRRPTMGHRSVSDILHHPLHHSKSNPDMRGEKNSGVGEEPVVTQRKLELHQRNLHVGFIEPSTDGAQDRRPRHLDLQSITPPHLRAERVVPAGGCPPTPLLHNLNSPFYLGLEKNEGYVDQRQQAPILSSPIADLTTEKVEGDPQLLGSPHEGKADAELARIPTASSDEFSPNRPMRYTTNLRQKPPKTFVQSLRVWNGRLTQANWFLVMLRPFILFSYPSVLWSALVYSLSVGWLIVLSESVSNIYRNKASYNFSALGTGLVYLSPFVGGVLGTAVAGKVSDIIVRFMSRRNGGIYEPEFRLVMAAPIMISTVIGLMGFGWSAQEKDRWIVPTVFFGIISFGCSLGSTTSITFCVDSYRQYAGEALVTLNFSKNIFHGLVFSLFFPGWLESDGPKKVFLIIGGVQIACMLTAIPMYIYGKRARMMTVRRRWMEKF